MFNCVIALVGKPACLHVSFNTVAETKPNFTLRSQGHYEKNGNKFLHKANETYVKIHIAVYIKKKPLRCPREPMNYQKH
jgi:hypothetical protein